MPNKGQYNFKKPIDKTPAEYAPMKVTMKKKVNLSDLPIKENEGKKYALLYVMLSVYSLIMIGIYFFAKWLLNL